MYQKGQNLVFYHRFIQILVASWNVNSIASVHNYVYKHRTYKSDGGIGSSITP